MIGKKIGKTIEIARVKKGWSREELSEKTENYVSVETIKRLERNEDYRISADKLLVLTKVLNVNLGIFESY